MFHFPLSPSNFHQEIGRYPAASFRMGSICDVVKLSVSAISLSNEPFIYMCNKRYLSEYLIPIEPLKIHLLYETYFIVSQ